MKKSLVVLLAGAFLLLSSCATNSDIDNLQSQIDGLKSGQIATIENQISSINTSISALQETDRELKSYISALQSITADVPAIKTAIESLQERDRALEKMIEDLQTYVDTQLKNTKDWASATFATLDQYNRTVNEIERIKASIPTMAAIEAAYTQAINQAIASSESSLKNWVNEQLKGYWTIAETEAKLDALRGSLSKEDEAIRAQLDSAKTELTDGYKSAIKKAIDENNGVIEGKIAEAVSGLNTRIEKEISAINEKIEALEQRMSNLESYLMSRIQSLSYIPRYDDGASTMWHRKLASGAIIARDTLDFRVSPADCADALMEVWESAVSAEAVSVSTRTPQRTVTLPIVSVTGGNGKISVVLDGSTLGNDFFNGNQKMKAVVIISDGNNELTSDYISMVPKEDSALSSNFIYYTSENGEIVTPHNPDAFGAKIISNEYKDGRGIIVFDGDVTSIGETAFFACSELASIQIPNSVSVIGGSAFGSCSGLKTVHIPNSVTTIVGAFVNCERLSSIRIPRSVTTILRNPFVGCPELNSIVVDIGNPVYDSRDNCCAIIETKTNTLIAGCNKTVIPNTVTSIGYRAFSGSGFNTIEIPGSVTSIGEGAFGACERLSSIRIPNSVTSIGDFAFQGCWELSSIHIPSSLTSIGVKAFVSCMKLVAITVDSGNPVYDSRNNCNAIIETKTNTLIQGCLNTIIPDAVTSIEDYALCGYVFTSINIPNSVTKIGHSGFYGCARLTSLMIPKSVSIIGDRAFGSCFALNDITFLATTPPTIIQESVKDPDIFDGTKNMRIYVPAESVNVYKTAQYWSKYADRIQAIPLSTPEAVDLGLSVKWASFNLGASLPEEYGDYYVWGEINKKEYAYWDTYAWAKGAYNKLSKYCPLNKTDFWYGLEDPDNRLLLEDEDEVVRAKMGGKWRMPSDEEWTALRNKCEWEWTRINGINGYRVKSGETGNSIFLPCAGGQQGDTYYNVGSGGYYWSSSLNTDYPSNAWYIQFYSGGVFRLDDYRCLGHSIRPVLAE